MCNQPARDSIRGPSWNQVVVKSALALALGLLITLGCCLAQEPREKSTSSTRPDTNNPSTGMLPGLVTDLGSNQFRIGQVLLNSAQRFLTFPATLTQTNVILEYVAVHEQGKTHESLLSTTVSPRDVHIACLLLGFKPYSNLGSTNQLLEAPPPGRMSISLVWTQDNQRIQKPLHQLIGLVERDSLTLTGSVTKASWIYSGSQVRDGILAAEEEGSIISLIRDPLALIQNPGIDRDDDDIHFPVIGALPSKTVPLQVRIERVD